jgi:GT2 family glycosyltransferase
MPETVSAVVVSFSDPAATRSALESLLEQTHSPIEVLLVDNHPQAPVAGALDAWGVGDGVRVVHSGENLGYARGCNLAAAEARGEWLFFLNPDARADPECLRALLLAADRRTGVVGAQILLPDGNTNAGHNPLHITGVAWAGRFGEPRETGASRQVAAVSGAGLLARAAAFQELGGMCEPFFMYYDDVDLCWRARLAGWEVVFCPEALVWHDYEFDKGKAKLSRLERNRLWAVLSNYSALALLLLSPLLIGGEFVVAFHAVRERWFGALLRAWASVVRSGAALRAWRRQVQSTRRASDAQMLELMSGRFDTELVRSGAVTRLNGLVELYRRGLLMILRAIGS